LGAARHFAESVWKAPLYLSYGQTESFGTLGAECEHKDGYHRNDLYFFFETPDVGSDGYGELVYTTLARDVMPLIRYRSTDVTRLVDAPCACGLFAKRITKIRARCDEMVVCGMGNVGPWVFEEILRGIDNLSTDWQAVVRLEACRDLIELHVELDGHENGLQQMVRDHMRERFADFWKNYQMGLYEFRVIPHERGSLRQARKMKRVVDDRQLQH